MTLFILHMVVTLGVQQCRRWFGGNIGVVRFLRNRFLGIAFGVFVQVTVDSLSPELIVTFDPW